MPTPFLLNKLYICCSGRPNLIVYILGPGWHYAVVRLNGIRCWHFRENWNPHVQDSCLRIVLLVSYQQGIALQDCQSTTSLWSSPCKYFGIYLEVPGKSLCCQWLINHFIVGAFVLHKHMFIITIAKYVKLNLKLLIFFKMQRCKQVGYLIWTELNKLYTPITNAQLCVLHSYR